jgi:hypothetical protein
MMVSLSSLSGTRKRKRKREREREKQKGVGETVKRLYLHLILLSLRYIPVVPTILVNGSEGIGVGWSTSVPCFNPRDLVDNLKRLLDGHNDIVPLEPWYRGFKGTIEPEPNGKSYRIIGKWEKVRDITSCSCAS